MQKRFSADKVSSIMESLGGMQPAAAPDFFYSRLRARMQQQTEPKKTFFVLRPAFITATLALLLTANVISLMRTDKPAKQQPTAIQSKPANIESFAVAYDMNQGSVYE